MNKKIKKYFLFFIFIISLLAFGNEVPNEKVMDNPEQEVTTVESMKTRDKATMSLTITKVNPIELDGTLENGKLTVKIPKKQTKMIIKSEDIKVKVEAIEKNPMLMKYNTKQILTSEDIRRILEEEGKRRKTLEKKYTIDKDSDENFVIMEISDVREEESKVNIAFFNNDNLMKAYSVPLKSPREDEWKYCPKVPYWSCINDGEELKGNLSGIDKPEEKYEGDDKYESGLTQARITIKNEDGKPPIFILPTSLKTEVLLKKIEIDRNSYLKSKDEFEAIPPSLTGKNKLYPYMTISTTNWEARWFDWRVNQHARYTVPSLPHITEAQYVSNLAEENIPLFRDKPRYRIFNSTNSMSFFDRYEETPQWDKNIGKCFLDFTLLVPSEYRLYIEDIYSGNARNNVSGVYTTEFNIRETFAKGGQELGNKKRTRKYTWTVPLIDSTTRKITKKAEGNSIIIDTAQEGAELSFLKFESNKSAIYCGETRIKRGERHKVGEAYITVTQERGQYAKILVETEKPSREQELKVNFTLTQKFNHTDYGSGYLIAKDAVLRTVNYEITFPPVRYIGTLKQEVDIRAYEQKIEKNADTWIQFNNDSYGKWNSLKQIKNFIQHKESLGQNHVLKELNQIILDNGTSTTLEIIDDGNHFLGREKGEKNNPQRITIPPNDTYFDQFHNNDLLRVSPIHTDKDEINYTIVAINNKDTPLSFNYNLKLMKATGGNFTPQDGYTGSAHLNIDSLTIGTPEEYTDNDFRNGNNKAGKFSNQKGHFINPNGLITDKKDTVIMSHYKIGDFGQKESTYAETYTTINNDDDTPAVGLSVTKEGKLKVKKLSNGPMNLNTEIIYLTDSNIGEIKLGKLTLTITNTGEIGGIGKLNQEVDIRAYDQLMQKNADKWIEFKSDSYGAWSDLTLMENFIGHSKEDFQNTAKLTTITQIKLGNKELKIQPENDYFLGKEGNGSYPQRITIPKGVEFNKIDDQSSLRISPIDTKGENITYKIVAVDDEHKYHSFDYNLKLVKGSENNFTSKEGYSGSATLNIDGVPVDGEEEYGNFVSRQLGKFENYEGHFINSKSLITGKDIITDYIITDSKENGKIETRAGQPIIITDEDNAGAVKLVVTNDGKLKVTKLTSTNIDVTKEIIYLSEVGTNNGSKTVGTQKVKLGKLTLRITSKGGEFELENPKDLNFGSMIYIPNRNTYPASETYKVKNPSGKNIEFSVGKTATMTQVIDDKIVGTVNIVGIEIEDLKNDKFRLSGTAVVEKETPPGDYKGEIIVTVKITSRKE